MPRRPSSPSDREAVRVLAVSDETSDELLASPDLVRSARLILACGDLPFDYLDALLNALEVPLVFVPGNHDPDVSGYRSSRAGLTLRAGLPARAPWPDGALNADRRILDVAGLRVAGLGGCTRYSEGPNQYSERQQARRALQPPRPGVHAVRVHMPVQQGGRAERARQAVQRAEPAVREVVTVADATWRGVRDQHVGAAAVPQLAQPRRAA